MSYPLAKEIAFDEISYGNFYDKVRRLIGERYIIERDGPGLTCVVLQLSKKGFEFLKSELGELRENRFAAQSVTHDYWATVVQLGDFVFGVPKEVKFFTEQQLQCADDSLLPEWVPKSRSHVPDGMTYVERANSKKVVAFEIELNLKPLLRYDKAGYYFDAGFSKFDVVLWVCANKWILNEIKNRLSGLKLRNLDIHQFVLASDVRLNGWDAQIANGTFAGTSIREIFDCNPSVKPQESLRKASGTAMSEIFFPVAKSARGLGR